MTPTPDQPATAPETTVSGAVSVPTAVRIELIADVLVEHTFDSDIGECMCGRAGGRRWLAEHVAEEVDAALHRAEG